jgi:hypothetical protein
VELQLSGPNVEDLASAGRGRKCPENRKTVLPCQNLVGRDAVLRIDQALRRHG